MPVAYTYEGDILWFTVIQHWKPEKRFQSLVRALKDRRFRPGKTKILWIGINMSLEDMPTEDEADLIFTLLVTSGVTKVAFAVNHDIHYFVAQQGCERLRKKQIPSEVFSEIPNARRYLEDNNICSKIDMKNEEGLAKRKS